MPAPKCEEKKKPCPCFESIDLSSEDEREVVPPVQPPVIPEPEEPGVTQDEVDSLKRELADLTDSLKKLKIIVEEHDAMANDNFSKIEQNMKFLASQIA